MPPQAVVAADDDLAHLQRLDREFQRGKHVHVRGMDDVRHVAMDKDLARIEPRHDVGRNTAVRTSDPEEFRGLQGRETVKYCRFLRLSFGRPVAVAGQDITQHLSPLA